MELAEEIRQANPEEFDFKMQSHRILDSGGTKIINIGSKKNRLAKSQNELKESVQEDLNNLNMKLSSAQKKMERIKMDLKFDQDLSKFSDTYVFKQLKFHEKFHEVCNILTLLKRAITELDKRMALLQKDKT